MAGGLCEPREGADMRSPNWAWSEEERVETISVETSHEDSSDPNNGFQLVHQVAHEWSEVPEDDSESLISEQPRRRAERARGLALLGAALALAAVAVGATSGGEENGPLFYCCQAVAIALIVIYCPLRLLGVLPLRTELPVGAAAVWLLCFLFTFAAPSRRRGALEGDTSGVGTVQAWGAEHCEEGSTAMWLAIVLAAVAALLPMPTTFFAVLSQLVCLQYLALGLLLPRPECGSGSAADSGRSRGPLLGMSPLWVSALQLFCLSSVLIAAQYQISAERRGAEAVSCFLERRALRRSQMTGDLNMAMMSSLSESPEEHQQANVFVLQTGLEAILQDIEQEERRWRRFVREARVSLPWAAGSCSRAWAALVGDLVEVVSSWREQLQSQGANLAATLDGRRVIEEALDPDGLNLEAVSQFVDTSVASGRAISGGDDDPKKGGGRADPKKAFRDSGRRTMPLKTIPGLSVDLRIGEWDFNALEVNEERQGHVLQVVAFELLRPFRFLPRDLLSVFLETVEGRYIATNPYHSHMHAADMTNSFFYLVSKCGLWLTCDITEYQYAAMIFAGIGHDVGHFGRNNMFLISGRHELAVTHNDRSVLENYHASTIVRLIEEQKEGGARLLQQVPQEQATKVRQWMISLILSTDTQKHLEDLGAFRVRLGADGFDPYAETSDQLQTFAMLFRAADIGHSAKSWNMHQDWSRRVSEEFHLQGDEEKRLGLKVSPLCDRDFFKLAASQVGFLQFICLPTWRELSKFEEIANARSTRHSPTPRHTLKNSIRVKAKFIACQAGAAASAKTSPGDTSCKPPRLSALSTTSVVPVSTKDGVGNHMARAVSPDDAAVEKRHVRRWLTEVCLAQCEENFEAWKKQAELDKANSEAGSGRGSRHDTLNSARSVVLASQARTSGSRHGTHTGSEGSSSAFSVKSS